MRSRSRPLLVLAALAVAVLVAGAAVLLVGRDGGGPTAEDRTRLAAGLDEVRAADEDDASAVAVTVVADLVGDPAVWRRLVAGGGDRVADLLDGARPGSATTWSGWRRRRT